MEDLLSSERKQKLDLLAHLVTNLQSALILRGESGAGKSFLLKDTIENGISNSDALLLNAELSLSFESIQYELLQFINKKYLLDSRSMADVLLDYEKQGKNLVLMIDDAGFLITGLINALINYEKEYSALKLVFSLTPEELLTKSQTDGLNNNYHLIDLLDLNYSQTSALARQLVVAAGDTAYSETDINSRFLQALYNESAGNLGEIYSFIKKNKKRGFNNVPFLISLIVMVAIISTVINVFLWRGSEENELEASIENKKTAVVELENKLERKNKVKTNAEKVNAAKQFGVESLVLEKALVITAPLAPTVEVPTIKTPQLDIPKIPPNNISIEEKSVAKNAPQDINKLLASIPTENLGLATTKEAEVFLAEKAEIQASEMPVEIEEADDHVWVLEQKETAYTMQLMALSSRDALLQEQRKFKEIGYSTYFLLNELNKKQVYTLYYGIFESREDAKKKSLELPVTMQKAWLRKISSIKKNLSTE